MFNRLQPFVPRYSFQDSYHMLKQLVITSDLPSAGEVSMNGMAAYRILSGFKFTPSTGVIQSSASKKSYLETDTNFIEEAPPSNVDYYAANGTHGRLILLRGSYPLYSLLVSVVKHQVNQNRYDVNQGGYFLFVDGRDPELEFEPLSMP